MLSKQLQIIISLMFVTIMFVQTPAIAGNNVASIQFGPKANSNDYQSGSQFLPEKSSSAKQIDTNNVENIAKITTNTNSIVAYNSSGTVVVANSSYVNPGQYINLSLNSSAFSNFYYNNAFTYSLSDPMGNQPYSNSTNTPLVNNTQNTVNLNPTWSSQSLNGQISYNATSYSKIYGVSINNPIPQSYSPTIERITWKTNGNTTSRIIYDTSNTLSSSDSNYNDKSIDGFRNSHSMFLTNLLPNTTYYYRIYGTDYFGRTINSTLLSFTTATVATGYPYITSAITLTVTNTTATLGYTPSVASNYILTYSTTRLGVTNGVPLTLNTYWPALKPGTQYFFKLQLLSQANSSLNTTYDNGGLYYSFVTLQNILSVGGLKNSFNSTSSQETVSFSTSIQTNASLIYSTDPLFMSNVKITSFDNLNTTHSFTINVSGATKYFYKLNITTDGINFNTIIASNLLTTSPTVQFLTLSTNSPAFFTFQTSKLANQDINIDLMTFIFEIPTYPAVLGTWQLLLSINKTDTISHLPLPQLTNIPITFLVNDSLVFNLNSTYIERGTFTNDTGTFPLWMKSVQNTYSPTDNLIFIGQIAYSTSPNTYINNSLVSTTGSVNLIFNNETISAGITKITDISSAETSSTLGLYVNSSILAGLDPNYFKVINVQIPAKDVYGNVSVQMALNFPRSQSFELTGYVQTSIARFLDVRYRLGFTNTTGQGTYSLTTTNFVGSATIFPYQYINVTNVYPTGNVSNFIQLPGSQINLTLQVTFGNLNENIFEFARRNYTWYWSRPVLESTLPQGNYSVNLLWTGSDGSARGQIVTLSTVYSSQPTLFTFSFSFTVSFALKDMTANMSVVGNSLITLRFKIIVPTTGAAWDQNLGAIVDGNNATFDPVTAEYSINITSASQNGQQNVTVTFGKGQTGQISYLVNPNGVYLSSSGASLVNTVSIKNEHVSLTDLGILGVAIIATIVYAAFVFLSSKRR